MKNQKRLIDANELIKNLGEEPMVWSDTEVEIQERNDWRRFKACVEAQPTVDAVEVVHGRWVAVPSSDMMTGKAYKCSECNKMRYGSYMPNYCQCCGAKMDGGDEDG